MTAPKKPAARRPATAKKPADHKPPTPKNTGKREITADGITVTMNIDALRSPRVTGDLMMIQEVADITAAGGEPDEELASESLMRTFRLLRLLFGFAGADRVHAELEKKYGAEYDIEHMAGFIGEAIREANPEA